MAALRSMQGDDNERRWRGGNLGAGSSESWSFGEGMAYAKTIMTARRCTGRVAAGRRVIVEWVERRIAR